MQDIYGKLGFIWWQGVVEDIDDPLKLGRCRVRIIGFHSSSKSDIPTENLPWATPIQPIISPAISGIGISPTGILCGTWVFGFFRDGQSAQQPVIFGTVAGIPQDLPLGHVGFNDPNEQYPTEDYLKESDVNRLARNENIEKTIVKEKIDNKETNITAALGVEWWEEPETPYNTTYPKNKVVETESGHIQEFDDTPGSERIHTYHKAGTFEEIHPDGKKITKVVTDDYEITLNDRKILIKGNLSSNVENDSNYKTNNLNVEVEGNVQIFVKGNITVETDGNVNHKVKGTYTLVSEGNMVFVAPRIDLNPNGYDANSVSDPIAPLVKKYDSNGNEI